MIKISDGKLGVKEFTALVFVTIAIKGTDTTPDLLIYAGMNASWVLPIFFTVFIFIPLLILFPLMKKHDQGLLELIFRLAGKKVGILICFLLFLVILSSTTVNSRSYIDIINTMYYPLTPLTLQYFLFLMVCYFIAKRGFESIGRASSVMVWYLVVSGIILLFSVWKKSHWLNLFPLAGPGIIPLLRDGAAYSSIFGEIVLLAVFLPFLRSYQDFRKASLIGFGFSAFWVAILCAFYTMVFDYPSVEYLNYPYHQLTRVASLGGLITHLDAIFLGFWVIASVLHFSIYLYMTAYIFARTLRLDAFEPLLLPLTGLILLIGLIPDNIITLNQSREFVIFSASAIVFFLPLFLWGLDRWKGRRQSEKA